ncbi:MAG: hypothetical protein JWM91_2182 [Rhodospirillales bacterium]|nr:hypothetical protein [Rhodospirillales bacterium]
MVSFPAVLMAAVVAAPAVAVLLRLEKTLPIADAAFFWPFRFHGDKGNQE